MFILPVVVFLLFGMIFFDKKKNIVESVIVSWLFITFFTWIFTEIFSVFRLLNTVSAVIAWGTVAICLFVLVIKKEVFHRVKEYFKTDISLHDVWTKNKWIFFSLIGFCIFVSVMSLLRSQNLIDNLYHRLAKIMHWLQNGTVGYFATNNPAEIQYTTLTEYMTMQVYLLKGNDRFLNLVQAGAYICSGCCIFGISRKLQASVKFACLSAAIYLLTPMIIIEVLTTQTDVTAGFYLLSFVYFLLDYIQADKLVMNRAGAISAICLSASVLFGYLAKPTVCFVMVVFFAWMCLVRVWKRDKIIVLLQYIAVGGIATIILFLPSGIRSYQYAHMPNSLYTESTVQENSVAMTEVAEESVAAEVKEDTETIENAEVGIETENPENIEQDAEDKRVDTTTDLNRVLAVFSKQTDFIMVSIRNLAANATSRCFPKVNDLLTRLVEKCESIFNYTNGYRYFRVLVEEGMGETNEPSPAIMFFLVITWILAITRISKLNRMQFMYLFFATIGMVLQSGLMGYTWYRQRYLIGAMAVLCPTFAVTLEQIRLSLAAKLKAATVMVVISGFGTANMLTYEIPYIIFGFQGAKIHQYFIHDSNTELYYQLMLNHIKESGYKTIGMSGVISYEYVLWQEIDDMERMEHVNVNPVYFEAAKLEDAEFVPECIVVETPEYIEEDSVVYCHHNWYICDWYANTENGNNYAIYKYHEWN